MRSSIAAFLTAVTVAGTVQAQTPTSGQAPTSGSVGQRPYSPRLPFAVPPADAPAKKDPRVKRTQTANEPEPPEEVSAPALSLPNDPIDPFLLTKDIGPFLVLAKTFRGPDAERIALALALELRNEYGLPAYILRIKDFPNRSMIRDVPPTAPAGLPRPNLPAPEKNRTTDEAAVLVGNEKTLQATAQLLHVVKKIKPKCLASIPQRYSLSKNLKGAIRTTNPYVPAQNLFPGSRDKLVDRLNQGKRSIYLCPGRYSLEIAQFTGRSTFDPVAGGLSKIKESPLAAALDDANGLAEALVKVPEIRQTGQPIYVYHDRNSSRVFIGAFSGPNDPAAVALRENLVKEAILITETIVTYPDKRKEVRNRGVKTVITPATYLTDLDDPQQPIRPPAK